MVDRHEIQVSRHSAVVSLGGRAWQDQAGQGIKVHAKPGNRAMKQAGGLGCKTTPLRGQCSYNNDCGSCITARFEAELPLHSNMMILFI